jgi:hypothetical protein
MGPFSLNSLLLSNRYVTSSSIFAFVKGILIDSAENREFKNIFGIEEDSKSSIDNWQQNCYRFTLFRIQHILIFFQVSCYQFYFRWIKTSGWIKNLHLEGWLSLGLVFHLCVFLHWSRPHTYGVFVLPCVIWHHTPATLLNDFHI